MKLKLFLFSILFSLTLLCCQKEDKQMEVNSGVIDPELAPFIESFREEGSNRELTFTPILNAQIVDDFSESTYQNQPGLAGLGYSDFNGEGARMEIKKSIWEFLTNLEKENLVYHELGHAFLKRNHLDARLADGHNPKSIMCSGGCNRSGIIFYEDGPLRDYYLNELFDSTTPTPDFLQKDKFSRTVFEDDFSNGFEDWQKRIFIPDTDSLDYTVFLDSSDIDNEKQQVILKKEEPSVSPTQMIFTQTINLPILAGSRNIVTEVNTAIEGLIDGRVEVHFLLFGTSETGNNEFLFSYLDQEDRGLTKNDIDKKFRIKAFCIPQRSERFAVSISVYSKNIGKVVIKDVKVDLFE